MEDPSVVVTTLRLSLDTLEDLARKRLVLEEALNEERRKDVILPKLISILPEVTAA